MEKHLSREKLELFMRDLLPADEAVEILLHLDECDQCGKLLPEENPQDTIERLLGEDDETAPENNQKI
jgi:hypothetical protein